MKEKIRKLKPKFVILMLSMASLLFYNCNDEDFEKLEEVNGLKTYYLTGNNAKKIVDKLNLKTKGNFKNSNTFRTSNGIEIDYDQVMVVENQNNQISYSFKVVDADAGFDKTFENIALVEKDGMSNVKLIKYTMSDQFAVDYYDDKKSLADFSGTIHIETLPNSSSCDCLDELSEIAEPSNGAGGNNGSSGLNNGDNLNNGQNGTSYTISIGNNNPGYNSGAYAGNVGGSGSGSGNGGGGGEIPNQRCPSGRHEKGDKACIYTPRNGGAIISQRISNMQPETTNATECCVFEDIGIIKLEEKKTCEVLSNLTTNSLGVFPDNSTGLLINDLNMLKNKLTNNGLNLGVCNNETGVEVIKTYDLGTGSYNYSTNIVQSTNNFEVTTKVGPKYIGTIHNHPTNGYPLPSFGDLKSYLDLYDNTRPENRDEIFEMVVSKDENGNIAIYNIKIDNIDKLRTEVNNLLNDPELAHLTDEDEKIAHIIQNEKTYYKKDGGKHEKAFLQKYGAFGIDLYKSSDPAMNDWGKLELSTENGTFQVKKTNC
jgi:hypothetical protein